MQIRKSKADKKYEGANHSFDVLVLMAKQDGATNHHDIATWLIDRNKYFCSLGYWGIRQRLDPAYTIVHPSPPKEL